MASSTKAREIKEEMPKARRDGLIQKCKQGKKNTKEIDQSEPSKGY